MIDRRKLNRLISAERCRERDLVVAMIVQRLIDPCSKLATTREWHTTTLAEELGVAEATENDLYEAMDWLLERQERIAKKLAARHLREGGLVLCDVSRRHSGGRLHTSAGASTPTRRWRAASCVVMSGPSPAGRG